MSNKGLYRSGFVFAILTAICGVFMIVGRITEPPWGEIGAVDDYLAAANSSGLLLYYWGGIIGSLFKIPVFLALFQGFRRKVGSVLAVPITFSIVGSVFVALGNMVNPGSSIYRFSALVSAADGQEATHLAMASRLAQHSIDVTWFIGGFLGIGGTIVWMAILFFRSTSVPRWLNWVGIFGGLAGFSWILILLNVPVHQTAIFILVLLNLVLVAIWLIVLSFILDRGNDHQSDSQLD